MSETVAIALITGVVSVGGTLLATLMANRHQKGLAAAARAETRSRELRELIPDMVEAGRLWISTQELWVPAMGKMTSSREAIDFFSQTMEMDSGKSIVDARTRLSRGFSQALLIVSDGALIGMIQAARLHFDNFAEEVMGPIYKSMKERSGEPDFETILSGLRKIYEFRNILAAIEQRAGELARN